MNRLYWILFSPIFLACSLDDLEEVQPESFIKFFDSGRGIDLMETANGGYLCLAVADFRISEQKVWQETQLIKTDVDGNVVWIQRFNSDNLGGSIAGKDITQLPGGGYLIVGNYSDIPGISETMFLLLADQQGAIDSLIIPDLSILGVIATNTQRIQGMSLTLNTDGTVYILGAYEDENSIEGMFLLNYDLTSNAIIWFQTTIPEFSDLSFVKSLHIKDNGDLLWVAGEGESYLKVYISNANSMLINESTPESNYFFPYVEETADNKFVVVGRSEGQKIFTIEIDNSGNLIKDSEVIYNGGGKSPSMAASSDGGVVILSGILEQNSTDNSEDFLLIKTDNSGNLMWTKSIGGSGFEEGAAIIESSQGSIVFFGTSVQDGIPRMTLVKTNKDGNIK